MADHAARFDPQFRLELSPAADPCPATTPYAHRDPPTREELAAAALGNRFVQTFIAERVPTWSDDRVRRNPTCCLVYEHGEVIGGLDELPAMIRHAEKRRDIGRRLGLRPLGPDEEVLPFHIGLRWGATHPRRIRYEQRMALRSRLARRDRRAVTEAMRRTQREFVAWARSEDRLAARIADATGLTIKAFWRAVRCRPPFRPSGMPHSDPR